MAITLVTPMDRIKLALNKLNAAWLTDPVYLDVVIGHARSTVQSYQFQRVTASGAAGGSFRLFGYDKLCLYATGTPYTETGGVSSTFNCGWKDTAPNITVTAGTQTGDTLTVSATPIDFAGCMMQMIQMIREHRLQENLSNIAGIGFAGFNLIDELDILEQQYRGSFGV